MGLIDIASDFLSGNSGVGTGGFSGFDVPTNVSIPDISGPTGGFPGFSVPNISIPDISAGAGGAGDFASRLVGGLGRAFESDPLGSLSKALGLGATGVNIGSQLNLGKQLNLAQKNTSEAQKAATSAAQPAVAFGTEQLDAASKGQLPAPMQAAVDQWAQKAKADMRARYAQMGQGNSSNIASEDANIDLMAKAMVGQLLQSQAGLGLQGIQTGASAATGGAQISQQQQAVLANLIASADQQLGRLGGAQA